jgi:hypothetical protein
MNQQHINTDEFASAMKTIRFAKNLLLILVLVALLVQAAGFVMVQFNRCLETPAVAEPAVSEATTQPAAAEATTEKGINWKKGLGWTLPAAKFIAFVCGILTVITIMFAASLGLLGRSGGVKGLFGAFFWSLILLAIVTPWQQIYSASVACGALYNLDELTKAFDIANADDATTITKVLYFARFLAYPAVGLLVWAMVTLKSSLGIRRLMATPTTVSQGE